MRCLDKVEHALLTVTDNVGHYEALNQTDQYVVWAEDGSGDNFHGDNVMRVQVVQGTIDYYTRIGASDPNVTAIPRALKDARISFRLNSVQYEDATKYVHYEWVFEVS